MRETQNSRASQNFKERNHPY